MDSENSSNQVEDPFENMILSDRLQMLVRNRAALRSPYLNQIVDVSRATTSDENTIWNYVLGAGQDHPDDFEVLYEDIRGFRLTRKQLTSMYPEATMHHAVFDTWASVLNYEESSKTSESPKRLFLPLSHVEDVMFSHLNVTMDQTADALGRKLVTILGSDPNILNLSCFDLIFFPVSEGCHFYLACFEMKTPRLWFIDNLLPDGDLTQYKTPLDFRAVLGTYLEKHGCERSEIFRELLPEFVLFAGQSRHKYADSGVFLMRFMEAFDGTDSVHWDMGFGSDEKKHSMHLRSLRTKYMAKILLTDHNDKRSLIDVAAREAAKNATTLKRARTERGEPSTMPAR